MKTIFSALAVLTLLFLISTCTDYEKRCDHDFYADCGGNCDGCPCCCTGCMADTCADDPGFLCEGCCCEEGVDCATDTCKDIIGFVCEGYCCEEGVNCLVDTAPEGACEGIPTWEVYVGANGDDQGWAIEKTADGDFVATGMYDDVPNADKDIYLIKVLGDGQLGWALNNYPPTPDNLLDIEYGTDIRLLPDNGFIIIGNWLKDGMDEQILLLRTDKDGGTLNNIDFSLPPWDMGWSVVPRIGGQGFLAYGSTETYIGENAGIEAIIYTTDAQLSSPGPRYRVGNEFDDFGSCIEISHDNNYVVLATFQKADGRSDLVLRKLDQDFNTQWTRVMIPNCLEAQRASVRSVEGGGFIIAGALEDGRLRFVRTDDAGNRSADDFTSSKLNVNESASVIQTLNDVAPAGFVAVTDEFDLIKVSEDLGEELWIREYEGTTHGVHCITEAEDGGLVVVGDKLNPGNNTEDVYIVKFNELGELSQIK